MTDRKRCNWHRCQKEFVPANHTQRYCCDEHRILMNELCKTRGGAFIRIALENNERDAVARFKKKRSALLKELETPFGEG